MPYIEIAPGAIQEVTNTPPDFRYGTYTSVPVSDVYYHYVAFAQRTRYPEITIHLSPLSFWEKTCDTIKDFISFSIEQFNIIKEEIEDDLKARRLRREEEKSLVDKCVYCKEEAELACDGCDKFLCLKCAAVCIEKEDFCSKCMEIKEEA
jgi:hypothetical protein